MVIKVDIRRGFGAIPNNRPPLWSSFPAWMDVGQQTPHCYWVPTNLKRLGIVPPAFSRPFVVYSIF